MNEKVLVCDEELRQRIFKIVAINVEEFMPLVVSSDIAIDARLADYGCNSIDRMDIVWKTLDDLKLSIPIVEFSGVNDISGLVDLLCRFYGDAE